MSQLVTSSSFPILTDNQIVLGNSASNAWCHLQGAKILLDYQRDTPETPCFAFFCKVFQYFNVMLALSMETRPLLINSRHDSIFTDKLDTVFGCTGRLWPLMHRLADIVGRLREGEDMTHEAEELAASLEAWSIETMPTADAYLEAMFQIAQAYKYCGLLVLRTILCDDCPSEATGRDREIYRAAFDSVASSLRIIDTDVYPHLATLCGRKACHVDQRSDGYHAYLLPIFGEASYEGG